MATYNFAPDIQKTKTFADLRMGGGQRRYNASDWNASNSNFRINDNNNFSKCNQLVFEIVLCPKIY